MAMSDLTRLLRAMAAGSDCRQRKHDVILLAGVEEIERLRTECDSLRVDAAELEQENGSLCATNAELESANNLYAEMVRRQKATNSALLEALAPFARLAEYKELAAAVADDTFPLNIGLMNGNVTQSVIRGALTVGAVRRAAIALAKGTVS